MSERETVDLTPTQRTVLTQRYNALKEAEGRYQGAQKDLNDFVLVVAGEGGTLDVKDGQVVVYRKAESPKEDT